MARVSGPLHSDAASGKFAGSLVYAGWKGRPYVRQLVTPSNPKSAKQTGVRAMLAFLAAAWKANVGTEWTGWTTAAIARQISTFNAYVSENLSRWQLGSPPSQDYPAAEATSGCAITSAPLTGHEGFASAVITPATNANIWGVAIFRDTAEITAPGWANCIAIVPRDDVTAFTYNDAPLAPGTYHYRFAAINTDGKMGTVLADASVVVT